MPDRPDLNLIRTHCDGECSPEQNAALEGHLRRHPEDAEAVRKQVAFEHQLRHCVDRVLKHDCSCAPAALRQAIAGSLRQGVGVGAAKSSEKSSGVTSSGMGRLVFETRRANAFAIAATLMIIAGAVLYGYFGRNIDQSARAGSELVYAANMYADQDHSKFTSALSKAGGQIATAKPDAAAVEIELTKWMGSPVHVFDLSDLGYEFVEAGKSEMPVPEHSAHLRYRKLGDAGTDAGRPMVSVFVVPRAGGCQRMSDGTEPGRWCDTECPRQCTRHVMRSTDGKLLYFVVCCNNNDMDRVTQSLSKSMLVVTEAGGCGSMKR